MFSQGHGAERGAKSQVREEMDQERLRDARTSATRTREVALRRRGCDGERRARALMLVAQVPRIPCTEAEAGGGRRRRGRERENGGEKFTKPW